MKTATLTIEVPDDFKKGDCGNCPLYVLSRKICRLGFESGDCPLEIQEKAKPICSDCILSDVCSYYSKDGKCSQSF